MRIIGGAWRGRRIPVPVSPGLRPTPDRVRETLFNWLQGRLVGTRVLDPFAGTGALGLEALSRGAAHATLVERDPTIARALRATVARFGADGAHVVEADANSLLKAGPQAMGGSFDLVLLDPPFAAGAEADLCKLLAVGGWLTEQAWVYVEGPSDRAIASLPSGWEAVRTLTAGAVTARLLRAGA